MLLSRPTPLEYFASLVADDAHFALTEAAISIAQDQVPDLDVQAALAAIDELGERLKRRIPADAPPLHRLRTLNRYFYNELAFGGNVNDFYNPANSFVHEVLRTRRGIPISLAIVYLEIAAHVGLKPVGVSFPGHFLIKLRMPLGEVIIDPMSGRSLSREELDERLEPYRRRAGLTDEFEVPLGLFLQAADPREIVARMLRNLEEIYRSSDELDKLLAVQERLVVLLPEHWGERRDRGLTRAQLGLNEAAMDDLRTYLQNVEDAADRDLVARQLAALRESGPTRWQ